MRCSSVRDGDASGISAVLAIEAGDLVLPSNELTMKSWALFSIVSLVSLLVLAFFLLLHLKSKVK